MIFHSIKKNREFVDVYHRGKSYANKYLVMYVLNNDFGENRFGITVRTTRLIRESIRLHLNMFEKSYDIVIVARNTAKGKKFSDVESAMLHLGRLHGILNEE